jgi:isoleucyl-tRNA synthetase
MYQDLVARHHPDFVSSVHHRDFPDADERLIDGQLEESMEVVREVVHLGRNLRKKEGHRVRQPLSKLTVLTGDPKVAAAVIEHADVITEELNIKEVVSSPEEGDLVVLSAKANFRKLGPLLGPDMNRVASAIAALPPDALASVVSGGTVDAAGREVGADDMLIERTARSGTVVEAGPRFAVALDTRISEELLLEGIAREVVSRVQRMRRDSGLEVTDRIALSWWSDDSYLQAAMAAHLDLIASEVLAASIKETPQPIENGVEVDGRPVGLEISLV